MKALFLSLVTSTAILISACTKTPELAKIEGPAQGTTYHITFEQPLNSKASLAEIEAAVTNEFARIDAVFSNYREDSAIEQFNAHQTTDSQAVDAELVALIEVAREVHRASHGCYDPTIKPLFELWGFKKDELNLPSEDALGVALASVGMDNLSTLDSTHLQKQIPGLRVDVSSLGQGYSVGQIASLLEQFGVQNYLVEIGGELQTKGKKPNGEQWRIALEKPLPNERTLHKIVNFNSGAPLALMTSGTYRHYFDKDGKRYSHILDARSGKPIKHTTVSVTVVHSDPTLADAWSTALLCLGRHEGLAVADQHKIAALFIDQHNNQPSAALSETQSAALDNLTDLSFSQP